MVSMVSKALYFIFLTVFTCVLSLPVYSNSSRQGTFSENAWGAITPIYKAITTHPFNKELQKGTLPSKKFDYYSVQDALYLEAFAKSLIFLSAKIDDQSDAQALLKLALGSILDEVSMHERRRSQSQGQQAGMSPATMMYSNYLLKVAAFHTREELAAALLPCFWIYLRLAEDMKKQTLGTNPYLEWIDRYSSKEYRTSVQFMLDLTDKLAAATDQKTRSKMMKAFVLASRMEWYSWEGAYQMEHLKP